MKNKEEKDQEKIISMIYFDEMGLAEISPNNPLKVIHSQLEYDENEDKISFVGVSNWTLDASKMNRGVYLAIPEPQEDDLQDTALTIAESYSISIKDNYQEFFENLASTYYIYKEKLKEIPKFQDFHGSRDFYTLIKDSVKLIQNKDQEMIEQIGEQALEKNFGGLPCADKKNHNSIYVIREIFKEKYYNIRVNSEYDVMKCIILTYIICFVGNK